MKKVSAGSVLAAIEKSKRGLARTMRSQSSPYVRLNIFDLVLILIRMNEF